MSADELRAAATKLREAAEGATNSTGASDWFVTQRTDQSFSVRSSGGLVCDSTTRPEGDYIALTNPVFGLAVADVLGVIAKRVEDICATTPTVEFGERVARTSLTGYVEALAVARSIVGDPS